MKSHGIDRATTNPIEGFNHLLKLVQDFEKLPLDAVLPSSYQLCLFYDAEITRGRYGLGSYTLREGLQYLYDLQNPPSLPVTVPPSQIVSNIRDARKLVAEKVNKSLFQFKNIPSHNFRSDLGEGN